MKVVQRSPTRAPTEPVHTIIDVDIGCILDEGHVLNSLPEPWHTRYASGNRDPGLMGMGYWNPNGVVRADAVAPGGTRFEKTPRHLARYFFDTYDLAYGILNPIANSFQYGLSQELDDAAAKSCFRAQRIPCGHGLYH